MNTKRMSTLDLMCFNQLCYVLQETNLCPSKGQLFIKQNKTAATRFGSF